MGFLVEDLVESVEFVLGGLGGIHELLLAQPGQMQVAPIFVLDQILGDALFVGLLVEDYVDFGGEDALRLGGVLSLTFGVVIGVVVEIAIGLALGDVLMSIGLFNSHGLRVIDVADPSCLATVLAGVGVGPSTLMGTTLISNKVW